MTSAAQAAEGSGATAAGGYGRGAAILSVGIGVTGLVTYAYLGLAAHVLGPAQYGEIALLWSAIFITTSVLYRPVEQLLSRTIADRDARHVTGRDHLRVAALIQLGLGAAFAVVALAARGPIEHGLLGGSATLYWILVVAVLAYAASYFARGFLAGHRRFGLYGGLVLMESVSRCLFAVAVAAGIAHGQAAVALGMAAAPILSLSVVPWALGRGLRAQAVQEQDLDLDPDLLPSGTDPAGAPDVTAAGADRDPGQFTLAHGGGFAAAVLLIMVSEQTFLNAGPLLVKATGGAGATALAGFAFNVLMIARAPLQLFQSVQTAILPHLTKLRASGQSDPFRRSINLTLLAIAGFAALVTLVMLAVGPTVMHIVFGNKHYAYGRLGLVLVAAGMGLYLAAATLNQAALARGHARLAAGCWLGSAAAFVAVLLIPGFANKVLQVEVAYLGGALLLCLLLLRLYRRPDVHHAGAAAARP